MLMTQSLPTAFPPSGPSPFMAQWSKKRRRTVEDGIHGSASGHSVVDGLKRLRVGSPPSSPPFPPPNSPVGMEDEEMTDSESDTEPQQPSDTISTTGRQSKPLCDEFSNALVVASRPPIVRANNNSSTEDLLVYALRRSLANDATSLSLSQAKDSLLLLYPNLRLLVRRAKEEDDADERKQKENDKALMPNPRIELVEDDDEDQHDKTIASDYSDLTDEGDDELSPTGGCRVEFLDDDGEEEAEPEPMEID